MRNVVMIITLCATMVIFGCSRKSGSTKNGIGNGFLETAQLQSEVFLKHRDSLLSIYDNAIRLEDYDKAIESLYEMDTVFYGYVQVVAMRSLMEYIRPFGMYDIMKYGDSLVVDRYLCDKNDGYLELMMFTQDVFKECMMRSSLDAMNKNGAQCMRSVKKQIVVISS